MSCCRKDRDNVAGAFDRDRRDRDRDRDRDRRDRRDRDDRVAGAQDDFCRRVRRCLDDDRVGGVEDRNRDRRCRNRGFWF